MVPCRDHDLNCLGFQLGDLTARKPKNSKGKGGHAPSRDHIVFRWTIHTNVVCARHAAPSSFCIFWLWLIGRIYSSKTVSNRMV